MALKYFVEAGAIAVRRVKKEDLRRIAKVRARRKSLANESQRCSQFCSQFRAIL